MKLPFCIYNALPIYRGLSSPNNSRETPIDWPLGRCTGVGRGILVWPKLYLYEAWHLTCHIIVKILESCLITVYVLWSWFLFAIVLCVCARPRVCEGERVWVFFVCLFCMPCVEWVWMFLVLLFYVIYSRTIASIANVFCWLYPTLNKVYLIFLSYLIFLPSNLIIVCGIVLYGPVIYRESIVLFVSCPHRLSKSSYIHLPQWNSK